MAFRPLEKLINLHDGYRRVFQHDSRQILLLQEDGEVSIIDRLCPHAGQTLDNASVSAGRVVCPRHQLCFSLQSGEEQHLACRALGVHRVVYEGNRVGIDG